MGQEIRITGPLLQVMRKFLLHPRETQAGSDIAKRTKLKSGTLYPILRRLEDAGWLISDWENVSPRDIGRPRRRFYKITGVGIRQGRAAFRETMLDEGERNARA